MQDRRQNVRKKTFLGGRLAFDHRQSTMECLLKNMAERGAKLVFANTAIVPDEFDIHVARLDRAFRARVAWRSKTELGVSFLDGAANTNVVPLDLAIRLRKLESDRHRLQQRVAELTGG